MTSQDREQLGTATFPSGDLFLLDFGRLRFWSGDLDPVLGPGLLPEELTEQANAALDAEIVGPDAAAVAARLDLVAFSGRYAFDVPPESLAQLAEVVTETARKDGLDARLEPVARMPHRERLARLLADRPDGAEVPFHGPWGVAVRGLPRDRALPVLGIRMDPDGPDAGRWQSVWVELDPREPASSGPAGHVLVDEARLMFADPAALGAWRNDEAVDGLADVVFWGRDATAVADQVGATRLSAEEFGWLDLPVDQAFERARDLNGRRRPPEVMFVLDFRPHDDHHRLLALARQSPTESGTVEVGGAELTGFFTSWGDGAFPVHRDLAEDGTVCRIRVELGAPETVRRTRRFEELWFGELSRLSIASARVTRDGEPVGWLFRETPEHEQDSGWRVFAGDETQEYLDDAGNGTVVPLRDLLAADPALEQLFRSPAPAAFLREPDGGFLPTDPPDPI